MREGQIAELGEIIEGSGSRELAAGNSKDKAPHTDTVSDAKARGTKRNDKDNSGSSDAVILESVDGGEASAKRRRTHEFDIQILNQIKHSDGKRISRSMLQSVVKFLNRVILLRPTRIRSFIITWLQSSREW